VPPLDPSKELRLLLAFFGESVLPDCEVVEADGVPDPWHRLLVHDNHMTVTLEARWGGAVTVVPYQVHRHGNLYGRKLDLRTDDGTVVMTGIMLINFDACPPEVERAVEAQEKPLGHILIESGLLRHISSESFVEVAAEDPLVQRFELAEPKPAWGRLATIFADGRPAIDLLEIVRPED
jgi:chorismate-pyruvate lyase